MRQRIAPYAQLAVAIETSSGPAVERLLEIGVADFPLQPKAAARYRERKAPSGVKDNGVDAWALADALRLDGHTWRRLRPEVPLIQELRLLCRDEVALIEQRTALVNQLQQAIYEYFPAAREAFDDWTMPAAWAFILQFPTPEQLTRAGRKRWDKFLGQHGLKRPETYVKRLEIFARADQFHGGAPVTAAKSRLAVAIARLLVTLQEQLEQYRSRIGQLFEQHPDHELFGSLPALGDKLAPRMLAECGEEIQGVQHEPKNQKNSLASRENIFSSALSSANRQSRCDRFGPRYLHLLTPRQTLIAPTMARISQGGKKQSN